MTEFDVAAELDVVVNPDSVDSARRQIESELGDIGVDASGSMAPTGRQPRNPRTGRFMSRRGPEQRLIEMQALDEERNDLLEELVELFDEDFTGVSAGGDDGFRFRPRPGGGGLLGGLGLGIAALIPLIELLQDPNETPVEDPDPVPVEDPDPVPVEDPDPVPVEDPPPAPNPITTPAPAPSPGGQPGPEPFPTDEPEPEPVPNPITTPAPAPSPGGQPGPEPFPTGDPEDVVDDIPGVNPNPDIDIPPTDGTGAPTGTDSPEGFPFVPRIQDFGAAGDAVLAGAGAVAGGALGFGIERFLGGGGRGAPGGGGGFGFPAPSIISGRFFPGAGDLAQRGGLLDGGDDHRQNQAHNNRRGGDTTVQNDVTVEVRDLGPIERSLRDLSRRLDDLESDITGSSTGRFRP